MLRLYIMRHAKSSWAVPGARDFDRELGERGLSDLKNISRELLARNYSPDHILCSPAIRTMQTLEGIKSALKDDTEISYEENLYASDVREYVEAIHKMGSTPSVMIIGHNPMCGSLASSLSGSNSNLSMAKIAYRYPTATVSVFDFEIADWNELTGGSGTLKDCLIAKEFRD